MTDDELDDFLYRLAPEDDELVAELHALEDATTVENGIAFFQQEYSEAAALRRLNLLRRAYGGLAKSLGKSPEFAKNSFHDLLLRLLYDFPSERMVRVLELYREAEEAES